LRAKGARENIVENADGAISFELRFLSSQKPQPRIDPTFQGTSKMVLEPLDRGSFPGSFSFNSINISVHPSFSWQARATTSANGRFIMIGQGKTGNMSYNGAIITRRGSPSEMWGIARLSLLDGRLLYNTINFNLTQLNQ
jgi:hypothetical protein